MDTFRRVGWLVERRHEPIRKLQLRRGGEAPAHHVPGLGIERSGARNAFQLNENLFSFRDRSPRGGAGLGARLDGKGSDEMQVAVREHSTRGSDLSGEEGVVFFAQ